MRIRGGDSSRLRRINLAETLRAVRGHGPIGLTDLARRASLSRPTVESLVEELLQTGWLRELPPESGQLGRPARLVRFRADAGHVLGVDIGSYTVRATVADLDGEVVATHAEPAGPSAGRAERLAAVRTAAGAALAAAGVDPGRVSAVCLGTTGVVTPAGVVKLSVGLPEWTGLDLAGEFAADFGCPVLVENDCNLAALAERWNGVARGVDDVVFVLSGVRTGAGILIRGELLRGGRGGAGEIGALPLVGWHRAPSHLAGYPGLPEEAPPEGVAAYVLAQARRGDPAARWAVEQYAHDLAEGIAALVLTVDPDLVVLGGGVSRSADVLLDPLRRHLDPLCLEPPAVAISTLGDQAVVLGAVRHALDHVDARLYDIDSPLPQPALSPATTNP
ncbi:ROK family transcriptional regulator [Bailinhaonella thermotolerans]|uniref:ROK family transcriptional regulator n=1 Tax=Bailinhaonella thermotolerans TaxID=1070861 RepID=A0A3A4BID5_9ACTN|nr:ROK family transcriptional regulator [Bailinhaonella thermotolerans]RJL34592.1 ROK family transcriptional regulator [Bailinhaonella thermotolerans]